MKRSLLGNFQLSIITGLISFSPAYSFDAWNTSEPRCTGSIAQERVINSVCYKSMLTLGHNVDSHAEDSFSDSTLRGYLGLPLYGQSHRLHVEASREFLLNNEMLEDEKDPLPQSQLHIFALDLFESSNEVSFLAGVHLPSFGVNFQLRDEQKYFSEDTALFGPLINGVSISFPSAFFDNYSFSFGKKSHFDPSYEETEDKDRHIFSARYGRSTSLLYKTNFYISVLLDNKDDRKIGLALLQSDHKNATTTLEFVRTGSFKSDESQFFRVSHTSPTKDKNRTRIQWDWAWDHYSRFSYFSADEIFKFSILEYEISHITKTNDDVHVHWQFGLNFKTIF